jgi:hypothetical protein
MSNVHRLIKEVFMNIFLLSSFSFTATPGNPLTAFRKSLRHISQAMLCRQLTLVATAVLALLLACVPARAETPATIEMKMLVVSADGTEPTLAAIQAVLTQIGVPFDTLIATQKKLTALTLSNGTGTGHYQGIFLCTGNLGYSDPSGAYQSAFSATQWQILRQYESTYRIRQATLFTYPDGDPDNYGLNLIDPDGVDTTTAPVASALTATGKQVFGYLNVNNPVTIQGAWAYFASPTGASNPVPLLTSPEGYYMASIFSYPDGRQNLTLTFDGAPELIHSMQLGYGIVNWVSRGLFLGEREVYMDPQVDDVLIPDFIWDARALTDTTGITFRMSGYDFQHVVAWQSTLNASAPSLAQLRLELAFNGVGASGIYANDSLTPAVKGGQGSFKWISHTWDHAMLDDLSYNDVSSELTQNQAMAAQLGLQQYINDSMVQPNISGLDNPAFFNAAEDFGIRYILTDTSVPGGDNPSPNAGRYSTYQANILEIPRYATNLYYNVSGPGQWVSEYNYYYSPEGVTPYWDHDLSYAEVLDKESDILLTYLLTYSLDPLMFHQPNLRAYDGTNSLLGDLMHATLVKYTALFSLPILSPNQHVIGVMMANRMAYNHAGVTASLRLGPTSSTISLHTAQPATVPVTGIAYGANKLAYGGQTISRVALAANGTVNIAAPKW